MGINLCIYFEIELDDEIYDIFHPQQYIQDFEDWYAEESDYESDEENDDLTVLRIEVIDMIAEEQMINAPFVIEPATDEEYQAGQQALRDWLTAD
jgi:hypothetical protein